MASVPFVIERRLQYHGLWNTGYTIGELFLKHISKDFVTKPPFPAILKLSISSLALTVFQKGTSPPRELRTDTIPFGALRDVTVNAFNSRCLMVIFVNNKNKFSVLVTSCRDAKEAADAAAAFKKLSAIVQTKKVQAEKDNPNWIMRKNDSSNSFTTSPTNNNNNHISTEEQTSARVFTGKGYVSSSRSVEADNNDVNDQNEVTLRGASSGPFGQPDSNGHLSVASADSDTTSMKSRTESSVLNENFDFLREHEASLEEDSVLKFGGDALIPVREEGPGENCFSVGLQVDVPDGSDAISLSSESSFLSFENFKDEIDHVTPSSAIAEEEYSIRMLEASLDDNVQNGEERSNGHADESSMVNGSKEEEENWQVVKVSEAENYDLRGVGIQTEGLSRTRYTKKSATTTMKSSNMYKAMAEQRKQKTEGNPRPLGLQTVTLPRTSDARPSSYNVSNDVRGGSASYQTVRVPTRASRLAASSSSTVNRPIEEVYQRSHGHTWSRRSTADPRKRKVLIVHTGRNSLRL